MKIHFYGDSWYWTWYPKNCFKSNEIKKIVSEADSFSFIEMLIKSFGHNIKNFSNAGNSFVATKNSIITTENSEADYVVVFFSSPVRGLEILNYNTHDISQFMIQYNNVIIHCLNEIGKWATTNDKQVLLFGGQSTLYREVFDKCTHKENLHLVAECLVSSIEGKSPPHGDFKIFDLDLSKADKWDPLLIDTIYTQYNKWNERAVKFTYPDASHLNAVSTIYFIDLLFQYIENLEKRKS
jgi:hypothetical protein